jgi:hypothetical protein
MSVPTSPRLYVVAVYLPTNARAYRVDVTGRSARFIRDEVKAQEADLDPAKWRVEVQQG